MFFTLNGNWLGLYSTEALAIDAMVLGRGEGFGGYFGYFKDSYGLLWELAHNPFE